MNCYFFDFSFFFCLFFFGGVLFFFLFWSPVPLFFCFFFFFGRLCPVFFWGEKRGARTKLCASFGVGSKGWVPNTSKSARPKGGSRIVEDQVWRPEGWGPEGWGGSKYRFFHPLPPQMFVICFSLWGSSRGIFGRGSRLWPTQNARLGFSGVMLCEPRGGDA